MAPLHVGEDAIVFVKIHPLKSADINDIGEKYCQEYLEVQALNIEAAVKWRAQFGGDPSRLTLLFVAYR